MKSLCHCGKTALRVLDGQGYCKEHQEQAFDIGRSKMAPLYNKKDNPRDFRPHMDHHTGPPRSLVSRQALSRISGSKG